MRTLNILSIWETMMMKMKETVKGSGVKIWMRPRVMMKVTGDPSQVPAGPSERPQTRR
jgi:hypothetical protein